MGDKVDFGILDIMAPAFFECLILVGIHSYLGIHVIKRKVIFVDLALAQIAALGTTVGFLFGILPGSTGAYWFSLGFTFVGAAVFAVSRFRHEKVPQEAIIGVTYAIAAAVAILVIDKAPHGAEHIKELLTGSILWVKWSTILNAAVIYSIIGIFHYIFRHKFLMISENVEKATQQGISVQFWDFLFYVSFGIVITHSVGTAGVLLVFVFLVVPAIVSIIITDVLWKQLAIGWGLGVIVSILGLYLSYVADLPSGPTVVAFYGVVLTIVTIIVYIVRSDKRNWAMLKVAIGVAVSIAVVSGFYLMGKSFQSHFHEHDHGNYISEEEHLLHEVKEHKLLEKMSEDELNVFLSDYRSEKKLHQLYDAEQDKYVRFKIAQRIVSIEKNEGLRLLLDLLKDCEIPFLLQEILEEMRKSTGQNFGFDISNTVEENSKALEKWDQYLKK
jgi:zinc/manganese transport system permease protein